MTLPEGVIIDMLVQLPSVAGLVYALYTLSRLLDKAIDKLD